MTHLDIVENDFVHKDSARNRLLIQIGHESLAYIVLSPLGRLMALKEFPFSSDLKRNDAIRQILMDEKMLHLPYDTITIGVALKGPVILPGIGHSDPAIKNAYEKLLDFDAGESIIVNEDDHLQLTYVAPIHKGLKSTMDNFFPNAKVVPFESCLIRYFLLLSEKTKKNLFTINMQGQNLFISVLSLGRLKFYNTYQISDNNDLVYFVMLVYNKLRLKAETTDLYFTGRLQQDSVQIEQLKRYIPTLFFPDMSELATFSRQTLPWSGHYFTDLFCLSLCA